MSLPDTGSDGNCQCPASSSKCCQPASSRLALACAQLKCTASRHASASEMINHPPPFLRRECRRQFWRNRHGLQARGIRIRQSQWFFQAAAASWPSTNNRKTASAGKRPIARHSSVCGRIDLENASRGHHLQNRDSTGRYQQLQKLLSHPLRRQFFQAGFQLHAGCKTNRIRLALAVERMKPERSGECADNLP